MGPFQNNGIDENFNSMTMGSARIGDSENYTDISNTGQRTSIGSACLWESLVLPMYGSPAGTKEAVYSTYGTDGVMRIRQLGNSTGTDIDEIFGMMQMPHRWKEGSSAYPYIHWCPMDDTAGTVVFQVNYATVRFEDGITAEEGTLEFHGTCDTNEKWIQKKCIPSIVSTGGSLVNGEVPMEGSLIATSIMLRIFRDGNHAVDDYEGAVGVKAFNIIYEADGDGAREKYVK